MMSSAVAHALLVLVVCTVKSASSLDLDLSSWMDDLWPVISNHTLLDLSVVGTHDSLTFDLSESFADNDLPQVPGWLSMLLHKLPASEVGVFVRQQAQTQNASLLEQLNGGARFIDFRMTYSRPPGNGSDGVDDIGGVSKSALFDWYGVHTLQTRQPAYKYLMDIRQWMTDHPREVVVLWFSRHSSTCATGTDQYPGTTPAIRQAFWNNVTDIFGDLIVDTSVSSANETTLAQLVQRGQRLFVYLSDWEEFSNSSHLAYDACSGIDIWDPPTGVQNQPATQNELFSLLANMTVRQAQNKASNRWSQFFLSTSTPTNQTEAMALSLVFPSQREALAEWCAQSFHIPGMQWCPPTLLDIVTLNNYYSQRVIEASLQKGFRFPNTFYLGSFSSSTTAAGGPGGEGCLYTGDNGNSPHRYQFVGSVLLEMISRFCKERKSNQTACVSAFDAVKSLRLRNPDAEWNDAAHGRLMNWPLSS